MAVAFRWGAIHFYPPCSCRLAFSPLQSWLVPWPLGLEKLYGIAWIIFPWAYIVLCLADHFYALCFRFVFVFYFFFPFSLKVDFILYFFVIWISWSYFFCLLFLLLFSIFKGRKLHWKCSFISSLNMMSYFPDFLVSPTSKRGSNKTDYKVSEYQKWWKLLIKCLKA